VGKRENIFTVSRLVNTWENC